ncbi:hypothetical protein OPV22_030125 [Ensete ventricosum]|uniref:Uncharacterized protein n=1 Tax=Ensete ventricosum TaxID=4639 RepID=A0AAV8Q382_ENSVE|nr:hypothetical protein OPV22_030125 [Ensete ventricosum]
MTLCRSRKSILFDSPIIVHRDEGADVTSPFRSSSSPVGCGCRWGVIHHEDDGSEERKRYLWVEAGKPCSLRHDSSLIKWGMVGRIHIP